MRRLLLVFLALGAPLFAADYNKPQDIADLFAKEKALTYSVYNAEGVKKDYTLTLNGQGVRTFTLGKLQGSAVLEKGGLVLTIGGKKLAPMPPLPIAGGRLLIWVQSGPTVRIAVPESYKSLRDSTLIEALRAELEKLDPLGGGYEEGYEEEGE